MKILLITEVFPPKTGGSGRWFWEIYRRLPRETIVVAAGETPRQEDFDRTHEMPVNRLPIALPSWGILNIQALRGYLRIIRQLRQLIATEDIKVIHSGKCLPEGLIALWLSRLTGLPYLCYVHGEEMNAATQSRELTWLSRKVLRRAEILIANSQNTMRILEKDWGVLTRRIRVLHPGVDTKQFAPATEQSSELRAPLGWGGRPVILTVGRLQKRKGHDRMILALGKIREAIPDVLYAIVGDGSERPYLDELVVREGLHNHVQFLGEQDDELLVRCYQQCDLFVLPNRQVGRDIEGFGIVLLEAQACGKPVVAGASGGTAETMRIPETGRVVPCDGPDELAAVIIELLSDRNRLARMGVAARRWTVERFDWEALSRQARHLFGNSGPDGETAGLGHSLEQGHLSVAAVGEAPR